MSPLYEGHMDTQIVLCTCKHYMVGGDRSCAKDMSTSFICNQHVCRCQARWCLSVKAKLFEVKLFLYNLPVCQAKPFLSTFPSQFECHECVCINERGIIWHILSGKVISIVSVPQSITAMHTTWFKDISCVKKNKHSLVCVFRPRSECLKARPYVCYLCLSGSFVLVDTIFVRWWN